MTPVERVRVAVIGAGYWGPNLIRNIATNDRAILTAVCDTSHAARERLAQRYPDVLVTDDLTQAVDTCDAVVIATPAFLHFEHANLSLDAGKHVMVEKPIATSYNDAIRLRDKANTLGLTLMVGHTYLYNDIVRDVKRRIDAGDLGNIYYIYSMRLNLGQIRRDIDVLWNLAPHDISIVNYWLDSRPYQVSARGLYYLQPEAELADVAFCQLDYPTNQSVHLHLSWLDPQKTRQTIIVGSQKMLVFDDVSPDQQIQIYDKRVEREYQALTTEFGDFKMRTRAGDLIVPAIHSSEPLFQEIDHFLGCVKSGSAPMTDALNGVEVVSILEALSQSMQTSGSIVPVNYPPSP